jgi:hypothetical protein
MVDMADDAPTTIPEAIEQAALGPSSVTIAGQSTSLPSISELIKADEYQAAKAAAANPKAAYVRQQRFVRKYD